MVYFVLCLLYIFVMQAKELDREPNEFEIFRRTHTRNDDQGQEVWVDNRAKALAVIVFMYNLINIRF